MALVFHCGSGSPYAWRVWLALEAKRAPYALRMISFSDRDHKKPDYLAINPRGKVPAITDDGFALYESNAIVEYLDERFRDGLPLFPGDLRQRALVRRLVLEADQYFGTATDPLLGAVLFTPRDKWQEDAIAAGRDTLAKELAFWETLIAAPFVAGTDAPTAADFALYPHLALVLRAEKRKPGLELRPLIGPRLAAWMARVEALPYFENTIPPHWKS